jgi:hypothetical protein
MPRKAIPARITARAAARAVRVVVVMLEPCVVPPAAILWPVAPLAAAVASAEAVPEVAVSTMSWPVPPW